MHPQEQDYPKFYRMEEMPLHPHETGLLLRKSVSDAVLPLEELNGSQETKERDRNDGSVPVTRFGECKRPEETSDAQDSLGFKQDGHFQDRHDVDVEKSHLHLDEHSSSHSTVTRTQNMPSGYTFTYANSSPHPSSSSLPRTSSSSAQRGASTRIPRYARRSRDYFVPTLTYSAPDPSIPTVSRSATLPARTTTSDLPDAAPIPSTNYVDPITSTAPPPMLKSYTPTILTWSSSSGSLYSRSSFCGSSKSGSPTLSATSIPNHTPTLILTATSTSSPPTHAIDSSTSSPNSPVLKTSKSMDSMASSSSAAVKPPTTTKLSKAGPNAKVKASGSSSVVGHGFPLHATTYTTTSSSPPVPPKTGAPKVNPKSKSTTSLPLSGTLSNPIGSTSTSSLTMTLHRPTSPLANSFTPDDASVSSRGSIDDSEQGQRSEKGYFGFVRTRSKSTGGSRKSVIEDDEKASSSGHGSVGHGSGLSAHPSSVPSVKTHQYATSHPPFQSLSAALAAAAKAPAISPNPTPPQASTSKVSSRASSRTSSTTTLPLSSSSTSTLPIPALPTKSTSHSQSTTYKGYAGGSIYGEGYGGTNSFPRMPVFMQKLKEENVDEKEMKDDSEERKHEASGHHQRARSEPGHGRSSSTSHRTSPSISSSNYHSISTSPLPSSSPFRVSSVTPSPSSSRSPSTTPSNAHSRTLSSPSPTQPTIDSPQTSPQTYSQSYTNSHTFFSSSPPPLPKPLHIRTQIQRPESSSSSEAPTINPSSPISPNSRRPLPSPPASTSSSAPALSTTDSVFQRPRVTQQPVLTQLAPVLGREASQPSAYYTPIWSPNDHSSSQTFSISMPQNGSQSGSRRNGGETGTRPSLPPLNREVSQGSTYYTPTWSPYSPSAAPSPADVGPTSTSRTPSYSHSRTWSQTNDQTFVGRNEIGNTNYAYGSYNGGSSGFSAFNGDGYFPPPAHQHQHQQQTSGSAYLGGHLRTWSQPHPYSFSHPNPQSYVGHTRGSSEPRRQDLFDRPRTYVDEGHDQTQRDEGRLSMGISLWDDDGEESESGSGRSFHTASSDEAESREEQHLEAAEEEAEREEADGDNEDDEPTAKRESFDREELTYSYKHLIPGLRSSSNTSSQPSGTFGSPPSSTHSPHAPKTPPRIAQTLPLQVQLKAPPRPTHTSSSSPPRHNSSSNPPTHKSYGWADKFPLPPSTTPTSPLGGVGGSTSLSPRSRYAPLPSPGSPNRSSVAKTTPTPTKSAFGVVQGLVTETVTSVDSEASQKFFLTARNVSVRSSELQPGNSQLANTEIATNVNSGLEGPTGDIESNSSALSSPLASQITPQYLAKELVNQPQDVEVDPRSILVPILAFPPKVANPNPATTTTHSPALPVPSNTQPVLLNEDPPHSPPSTSSSPLSTLLPYPPGLTPPPSAQVIIPSFGSAVTGPTSFVVVPTSSQEETPLADPISLSAPLFSHPPNQSHNQERSESSMTNSSSNPASNPSTFGFSAANPYGHSQLPSNATSSSPSRFSAGSRNTSFVLISGAKFVDETKDKVAEESKDKAVASTTELESGKVTRGLKAGAEEMTKEEDMDGYEPQWPMKYLTSARADDVDEMGVKFARGVDESKNIEKETTISEEGAKVEEVKKKGRKWLWRRSTAVVEGENSVKGDKKEISETSRGPAEELIPQKPSEHAEVEGKSDLKKLEAEVEQQLPNDQRLESNLENVAAAVVEVGQHLRPQSHRFSLITRMSRRISIKKDNQEAKRRSRSELASEDPDAISQRIQDTPKEKQVSKKHTKLRKKRRYSYIPVLPLSRRASVLQDDSRGQNKEVYERIVAEEVEGISSSSEGYLLVSQRDQMVEDMANGMKVEEEQECVHEKDKSEGITAEAEDEPVQNDDEDRTRTRTVSSATSILRSLPVSLEPHVRPLPQSQTIPHTPPLHHLSLNLSLDQHEANVEAEAQSDDDDRRGSALVKVTMDVDPLDEIDDGDGDDDIDENDFSFVNPIQLPLADTPEEPADEIVHEAANEWEDVPFSDEGALFVNISPGAASRDEVEPFIENYPWTAEDDDSAFDTEISAHQEETRRRIEEMLRSKGLDVVYEEDEEDEENGWVEDEPDGTTQEHQALETRRTLKKRESYPHIRDKGKARARAVVAQDADYQRGPDFNSWASLEGVEDAMYAGGYGGRGVVQEDDDEDELAQEEYEGEEEDEEMEMEIFEDALEPIEEEPDLEEQANERDRLSGLIASATSFDPKEHQPSSRYYHQNHIDDQQQYESSALDTYSKPSDHEGPLISGDATESTTPTMTLTPASSMMLLKNPLTTTTTTVSPATTIAAVTPVLSAQILKDPIPPLPAGAAQPARSASFALNISTSMNGTSTTGTSTPTLAPGTPASKLTPLRRVPKSRSGSSLRQMRVGGSRESLRDRMGTVGSKRSPKVSRERLRTPKGSKEGLRTPTGSREGLRETRRSEISTNGKASRKEEKKRKTLMKPRSAKSSVIGTSSSTLKGKERESQPELSRGRSQSKPSSSKKPVKKPSQASLRATRRPTSSSSTPKTFLGSLRMSLLRPIHLVFGTNRRRLSKELRTPNTLVQNRRFSEKYIPRFPSRLDGIRGVEKRVAKYE